MPRRKTHEEFLEEVTVLVGNEYEVLGKYINTATKIPMKHIKCGLEYEVTPNGFLSGNRCPICSKKHNRPRSNIFNIRKTQEQFKKDISSIHGREYTVLGEYKTSHIKISMKHNICGFVFDVRPYSILNGSRCPKCSGRMRKTTETFKKEVFDFVGDEYSLLGEYEGSKKKIRMRHNKCSQEWDSKPNSFLNGHRCPKCGGTAKSNLEEYKNKVLEMYADEYEILGEYKNNRTKILTKHSLCGHEWSIKPNDILMGVQCPRCKESKGERAIRLFLEGKSILHSSQYRFKDCRYKSTLPFDFAIFNKDKSLNCLIEFDGQQHFKVVECFGGEREFEETQKRDQIKNQYCKDNNIKLIRIPYWDFDNIESVLDISVNTR